jgi:hypothetical protein
MGSSIDAVDDDDDDVLFGLYRDREDDGENILLTKGMYHILSIFITNFYR